MQQQVNKMETFPGEAEIAAYFNQFLGGGGSRSMARRGYLAPGLSQMRFRDSIQIKPWQKKVGRPNKTGEDSCWIGEMGSNPQLEQINVKRRSMYILFAWPTCHVSSREREV